MSNTSDLQVLIHDVDVSICVLTKSLIRRPSTNLTSISTTKSLAHMFTKFKNLVDLTCDNYGLLFISQKI